jgi:hypothetical protein
MHGPTCIFWASLTPFSLKVSERVRRQGGSRHAKKYDVKKTAGLERMEPITDGRPFLYTHESATLAPQVSRIIRARAVAT